MFGTSNSDVKTKQKLYTADENIRNKNGKIKKKQRKFVYKNVAKN